MGKPNSIAIIAGQLVVGGAERQLYLWLANLDRSKFNPIIITLHPGHGDYWEKPIEDLGIPLYRVQRNKNRLFRLFQIIKILRPTHPKLIHGWHLFASPYAGFAAKILKAKSLGGLRDTYATFTKHPKEALLSQYLTDAILVNSKTAAFDLESSKKRKKLKIYSVQNAVSNQYCDRQEIRQKIIREFGLSGNDLWIGSMSRLVSKKRFDLMLQIIALLKHERNDFHFLLIGDGPEKQNLVNLSIKLDIKDKITFVGEIPMASTWLKSLDIFCFTSHDEGLPNVILEASAAGLPIVAWRYPFIEELIKHMETGLLFTPGDIDSMKNGLIHLMKEPELRSKLGKSAQDHVNEHFSLESYTHELTRVYFDLIEGS